MLEREKNQVQERPQILEGEKYTSTHSLTCRRLVVISFYFTSLILEPILAWATIGPNGKTPLAYYLGATITSYLSLLVLAVTICLCGIHYQYFVVVTRKITITQYNRLSNKDRNVRDKANVFAHRINTIGIILFLLFILMNLNGLLFPDFVLNDIKRIAVIIPFIAATLIWSLPVVIIAWTQEEAFPRL